MTAVYLVDSLPDGDAARAYWDSGGSHIEIVAVFEGENRRALLEHELWHLLTLDRGHPNGAGCVSQSDALAEEVVAPCEDEVEQVRAGGRLVRVSFPEDRACAVDAAYFWNLGLGRVVVLPVE